MQRKKMFAVVLLCCLLAVLLAVPAFAHGGHHGGGHGGGYCGGYNAAPVPACGYRGCAVSGTHSHTCAYHPGTVCAGNCYALCSVEGCAQAGQ